MNLLYNNINHIRCMLTDIDKQHSPYKVNKVNSQLNAEEVNQEELNVEEVNQEELNVEEVVEEEIHRGPEYLVLHIQYHYKVRDLLEDVEEHLCPEDHVEDNEFIPRTVQSHLAKKIRDIHILMIRMQILNIDVEHEHKLLHRVYQILILFLSKIHHHLNL